MCSFCYILIIAPSVFPWHPFLMGLYGWGPSEAAGWATREPEKHSGSMKYLTSAPVVLLLEKASVHYGIWKQEIMNSTKIYF